MVSRKTWVWGFLLAYTSSGSAQLASSDSLEAQASHAAVFFEQRQLFSSPLPVPERPDLLSTVSLSQHQSGLARWVRAHGHKPVWRESIAYVANCFGGALDRLINNKELKEAHRKSPLPNSGVVNLNIYRGGEPSLEGLQKLKIMGIDVVINLRYEDNSEEERAKRAGLEYHSIPIPDTDVPTPQDILDFFLILDKNAGRKVFIHCAAGMARTSMMVGLYQLRNGISYDEVMREASSFHFDPEWLLIPREKQLLANFSTNPQKWLELARQLPQNRRHKRRETLRLLP
ncbi:MAG: dual specificity protein phosphatase family protein [Elusimicrobia bacterium]|nr:dual specificity protein phosphatase family protein [Elusimicrobiota bacterium]